MVYFRPAFEYKYSHLLVAATRCIDGAKGRRHRGATRRRRPRSTRTPANPLRQYGDPARCDGREGDALEPRGMGQRPATPSGHRRKHLSEDDRSRQHTQTSRRRHAVFLRSHRQRPRHRHEHVARPCALGPSRRRSEHRAHLPRRRQDGTRTPTQANAQTTPALRQRRGLPRARSSATRRLAAIFLNRFVLVAETRPTPHAA